MTNKQMEQRLAQAAASLSSNLPFEQIAQAIPATDTAVPITKSRRRPLYVAVAAVAACVVVVALAVGGLWHHLTASDDPVQPPVTNPPIVEVGGAVIDIDVNPSVELTVDTAECISAVTAVNTDAALLLSRLDLTQQPLAEGVQALFGAMVAQGYVTDGNNPVLVTVQSEDANEANRLHALVNNAVDAAMAQHNLTASVANQTVTTFDEVAEFARQYGISNGKAAFILKLAEQDPRLDAEALTDHAFAALAAIAQHENVPLGDLVDYDATDGLWEDIVNALSAELTEAEHRWGSMLKVSEVKALALDALPSDYIAENALVVRIDFSWEEDEEYPTYCIELVSLGYLYEYTINALDGTFLNPNHDSTTSTTSPTDNGTIRSTLHGGGTRVPIDEPTKTPPKTTTAPSKTTVTTTVTRPTDPSDTESVSAEWAKDIVFGRLGITEAEAQSVSVGQHPTDQEMSVWFIYEDCIHCVYLNSVTGNVTKSVYLPLDIAVSNYRIDEWEALQIALTHANTPEADSEITIMYYVQNDAPFIDIIWMTDNISYYYRIDGVDGTIVTRSAIPLGGAEDPPSVVIP